MKKAYAVLINELLQQYHFKKENLNCAVATAEAVRQLSLNDYAFRLSVGMEGLASVARAAGDDVSADALESLVSMCNCGEIPSAVSLEHFSA